MLALSRRRGLRRAAVAVPLLLLALAASSVATAYSWPVKPFHKPHAIRGAFGDPRYHLGAEGALSAYHFGVDIVARDGAPVYAVEPGVVIRRHRDSVTIGRASGRRFGYWHIRPVVKSGTHVRLHQLLGHVIAGWGHVHFAESVRGSSYRNPLRKGALTPFYDHTAPTVAFVEVLTPDGLLVNTQHVVGLIDILVNAYDTPQIAPPAPWDVARFAPAAISWTLVGTGGTVVSDRAVSFQLGLPLYAPYGWIYAPGTYQNKPHRPGFYNFWVAHAFDTARLPDGTYTLQVTATDTRNNVGSASLQLTTANGVTPLPAPGAR